MPAPRQKRDRTFGAADVVHELVGAAEALNELVGYATQALVSGGIAQERAHELAQDIAARLAAAWGGRKVRLPRGQWGRTTLPWAQQARRNLRIYREYNGTNGAQIRRRYGISRSRLYEIIHEVRYVVRYALPAVSPRPPRIV